MFEIAMVNEPSVFELLGFDYALYGLFNVNLACYSETNDTNTDGSFTVAVELVSESPGNSPDSSRKHIFRDISGKCFYFIMKMYVEYTH